MAVVAQAQVKSTAELTRVAGRVEVLRQGQTQWSPGIAGLRLGERDEVRALANASAELKLPDGSTVFLAENSRLVVTRLEFDPGTQTRRTIFHLAVGKVRAVVAQAAITLVRTRQSIFAISTPTAVAAARGTVLALAFVPAVAKAKTTIACKDGVCLCGDLTTQSTVSFGDGTIVDQEGAGGCGSPRSLTEAEADIFSPIFPLVTLALTDPGRSPIVDPAVVTTTVQGALQAEARVEGGLPITPTPTIPVFTPVSQSAPSF
jgi:hypothetical protein